MLNWGVRRDIVEPLLYENFLKSLAPGYIGIWPFTDTVAPALDISGNGLNGTYDADAVKAGAPFPVGKNVVSLLGNGAIGLPVAGVDALMNFEEYTVLLWVQMPVVKWVDTTSYTMLSIRDTGSTQYILIRKNTVPGQLALLATTGAALLAPVMESVVNPDWMQIALTTSKIANQTKGYLNGNQISTTKTGVGTDNGSALAVAAAGAGDSAGVNGITGAMGYLVIYAGTILPQALIRTAYDFIGNSYNSGTKNIVGTGDSTWTPNGRTTAKLITALGAGYGFVREIAAAGITSAQWKNGVGAWLGIDVALAAVSFNRDPFVIITCIGKNDMSSMPTEANFKANYGYCLDALHTKWPNAKVVIEIPWRTGQDVNAGSIKTWLTDLVASRSWSSIGTDETDYFRTAELATPGSYSSDGVHIDTDTGMTARAAVLAAAIAAL